MSSIDLLQSILTELSNESDARQRAELCQRGLSLVICARPRASLPSLLLSCADSATFMCRISLSVPRTSSVLD